MNIYSSSKTENFIQRVNQIHNYKFRYSKTKYVHVKQNIIITCVMHGDFLQTPNNHINGQGCPRCAMIVRKSKLQLSKNEFICRSIKKHGTKFSYDKSQYVNNRTKLIITCPLHGDFYQIPDVHMNGKSCPKCNESQGERRIRRFLENNNIDFQSQYRIKECKNKKPLPFDFAIFSKSKLQWMIEFHGKHHYIPTIRSYSVSAEMAIENLKTQQMRDSIKSTFCKLNQIPLLVISYKDDIESSIINFLFYKNSIGGQLL